MRGCTNHLGLVQPLMLLLGYRGAAVSGAVEEPAAVTRGRCSPT